ncbi:5-methyltetrahydropteroyltriglutamate--homocysteine S-methyltransferase [Demequina sp. SYSU T00039]|uniref:5-methyltetrahydropteroyltriglutamate--homocysteine S-methyltransferase n=1 Tax=Demequina lignilytica TaxID=3051663 RepID=A0AAW7M238_9MICO|nr:MULTISPECIES: 5-methyltetrahydropteroyltriglutamate--homocysteine S-methyltransferase [unclassified Demequina]MDN4477735.1 5-methyltetrahydropteroyltriglutamate--homocysteine S-methyltransferase [Demequina sp. SYSU T00039-1]MDN4487644.1 5-methyltetrahydropteroyltriglutamate--homocysteine S-methyltransferase [Demequina sp. SYSU T00039]
MTEQNTVPAPAPAFPGGTILGYPRIGRMRELKKALESFWTGATAADDLEASAKELRLATLARLAELGLDKDASAIPSNFSFYDHVLDAAVTLGAVPTRFADLRLADGSVDLAGYSTIARGEGAKAPLEMTKWFDSNYHYLVPEIGPETHFAVSSTRWVDQFVEAKEAGYLTRPVITGPLTFLYLSKPSDEAPEGFRPIERLEDVLEVYGNLLEAFKAAGAEWVQIDEPILVADIDADRDEVLANAAKVYGSLATLANRPQLFVAAPYNSLDDALPVLKDSGVEAIGLDLVRGGVPSGTDLSGVTVVAGVVDGHNIWRTDLDAALRKAAEIEALGATVAVSSSTSLFHVPHTLDGEEHLGAELLSWLAFAEEKVAEVVTLATARAEGADAVADALAATRAALASRKAHPGTNKADVRAALAAVTPADFSRPAYAVREAAQDARFGLPELATTTIGSFPQTTDIRKARAAWAKGQIDDAAYEEAMKAEIERVVRLQEDLDLDVLVHGEAERNDMVQYFAELLDGFDVTVNGWVQSYGSRCTRPSILWGDVTRPEPMTVRWTAYAQSLTEKPMKGMLTGPVTILAWSFVRDDQPLGVTANQVALALRDEIRDLEAAGIGIIQVDEPALRELLPLKKKDQAAYLQWSVDSFRLATAGAHDETQVHTHLCYSEFGEIIDAIDGLDADVTSIEAARSRMEVLPAIRDHGYERQIGPGVWDIHSPRVPSTEEITELLALAKESIPGKQLWVNPDCGLKTRAYAETTASLEHMMAATQAVRA